MAITSATMVRPRTGERGPRAVTETFVHTDPVTLVALDVEDADGSSAGRIVVTGNHPVWQAVEGRWLPAEKLLVGDWVHDADGEYLRVAKRTFLRRRAAARALSRARSLVVVSPAALTRRGCRSARS